MDCRLLTGDHLDLSDYRLGSPQQAGCLTVVPITAPQAVNEFLPPSPVTQPEARLTSGPILLPNPSEQRCLLVPLHYGLRVERGSLYFPARVALVPPGERRDFAGEILYAYRSPRRNYAAVPAKGYLPLALRNHAWQARNQSGEGRLNSSLSELQARLQRDGLSAFPAVLQARHSELHCLMRQIELLAGQTGALFFIDDRPVGLEIAPSPAYFAAIWQPLLVGCYGLTALLHQHETPQPLSSSEAFPVSTLTELRTEMFRARHQRQEQLEAAIAAPATGEFTLEPGQRWRNYRVQSLTGPAFTGQYIEEVVTGQPEMGGAGMPKMLHNLFRKRNVAGEMIRRRVVYASLFAQT